MGKQKIQVLSNISLLLVAIIWGSGFVASQMALDANLSSAFIMFVRFADCDHHHWMWFFTRT